MNWFIERLIVGRKDRNTVAKTSVGLDRYNGFLLVISAALLGAGFAMPIVEFQDALGLSGKFSVFNLVFAFLKVGQGALSFSIGLIIIIIPVMITASAFDIWYKYEMTTEIFHRRFRRMRTFTKLWILSILVVVGGIYYVKTNLDDAVIFQVVYYLLLALVIQRLAVSRIMGLVNMVKFVESAEND